MFHQHLDNLISAKRLLHLANLKLHQLCFCFSVILKLYTYRIGHRNRRCCCSNDWCEGVRGSNRSYWMIYLSSYYFWTWRCRCYECRIWIKLLSILVNDTFQTSISSATYHYCTQLSNMMLNQSDNVTFYPSIVNHQNLLSPLPSVVSSTFCSALNISSSLTWRNSLISLSAWCRCWRCDEISRSVS